jgi:hypothetical protein
MLKNDVIDSLTNGNMHIQGFQGQTRLLISEACNQGDQIGRIFNIWLLFTWVFLKFYLNKQFQNTVCSTYFNIQKLFDATIFDFQFELL